MIFQHKIKSGLFLWVFCFFVYVPFKPLKAGVDSNLDSKDIFEKVRQVYQSLTSYSDNGTISVTSGGITTISDFQTRLRRPYFYRIEWAFTQRANPKRGIVWSLGGENYFNIGNGVVDVNSQFRHDCPTLSKSIIDENSRLMTVGAIQKTQVPRIFFDLSSKRNFLLHPELFKKESEQNVNETDCSVFTEDTADTMRTIWIGKQDFLIHQVKTVTDNKKIDEAVASKQLRLQQEFPILPPVNLDFTMVYIETHSNILINPGLNNKDFLP